MAEDDDWDKEEGKWTKRSKDADAQEQDSTRYFELPDGEVVEGEPPDDVPAEPVEPPEDLEEDEDEGLALFGGEDDEEPDEEDLEAEDDEDSKAPLIAGAVVVIVLIGLIALVALALLNVADPLGIGDALGTGGTSDGTTGATDGNGGGGGGNQTNETPLFSYPVNWSTSNFTVSGHATGRAQAGANNTTSFNLSRLNVTQVTFTLTFNDTDDTASLQGMGDNQPDTLQLNVTSPGGETKTAQGSGASETVSVTVTFEYVSVPTSPTAIEAESRANATRKLLTEQPAFRNGTGEYGIEVAFRDGGSSCVRGGATGVGGNTGDCSEDWTLDVSYTWYMASLGEPTKVSG